MKKFFKRVGAYIIDILIVSIIAFGLSSIKSINYQLDKYNDTFKKTMDLVEKYNEKEITEKEYKKQVNNLNYKLEKNSTISSIISMACLIGYFGIFQFSQNGRTLGKRVFKLQVVKKDDESASILSYLIRSVILNNIIFTVLKIILVYTLSKNDFMNIYSYINNSQAIFQLLILVSMLINVEGRGIHDLLAGTKVIDLNEVDEFEAGTKKVVEGEIIK